MNLAIIAAAGRGDRFGRPGGKQFADLLGRPLIAYAVDAFEKAPSIHEIIMVVGPSDIVNCRELVERLSCKKVTAVIEGGGRREESVYRGLEEASGRIGNIDKIAIHDGARPLIAVEGIERAISAADNNTGAILAVPATDTIKICDDDRIVIQTPPRDSLWLAQTPQVFPFLPLMTAYGKAVNAEMSVTDDAAVFEAAGGRVKAIMGDYRNMKVTTEADLNVAAMYLRERTDD